MTEAAIRTRLWRDGVLEKEDFAFEELSDYVCQPDCMVWADLRSPDAALLAELGEELSLDKLAIEDAVTHHERPKATRYASHTFLSARGLQLDSGSGELRDVQVSDHVLRATEWTESLREMITSLFETNLSLQDARLNTIMKKLTSYTALIAIPTAVTGFYDQNVPYPGFGHHSGFISSVLIIAALGGALYLAFKRNGWL